MSGTDALVVYCTVGDEAEGRRLAGALVADKLAACVNLVPGIGSFYWWDGEVRRDDELLLIIKTDRDRFERLAELIEREHSYDCPEVVALPVVAGSPAYLEWIHDALQRPD